MCGLWENKAYILWSLVFNGVWAVGSKLMVSMDDRGRILIPKSIRRGVKARLFTIELMDDNTIVLKPVASEVLELAGKFRGLLKSRSMEELEERQEEYVERERGI